MFKQKLYCSLAVLVMLVGLIPLSTATPAYASSQGLQKPHLPSTVYGTYAQPDQVFFDSDWGLFFTSYGYLTLFAAYVSNPATLIQQQMQVNISPGAFYSVYPNTYDAVYTYSGALIGDYSITGGGCISSIGAEDSTICGSNYATITTSNYPVVIRQWWLADDSGLYFSGYWTVHPDLR